MSTSHGRYCRRCRHRISRRVRLCALCGAVNLKPLDYVFIALLLAAGVLAAWRWM